MSNARPVNASIPFMVPLRVDLAADRVELAEQVFAVVEPVGVHAVGEPQVLEAGAARA